MTNNYTAFCEKYLLKGNIAHVRAKKANRGIRIVAALIIKTLD
jgi:hypothetical protein